MRVRQIGAVLHVRDTPGCLWFLGLWFIAGATLCIASAFLASNASTLAWWERLVIIGIGTGCGAAGVFVLYTTPATIARFDRGTGRGEIIVRGLRRRERTLFALDDARFVDIVESRDSDGDAMFQIRLWLAGSRVVPLQAQPVHGREWSQMRAVEIREFLGLAAT
jgi:hypothetical protein